MSSLEGKRLSTRLVARVGLLAAAYATITILLGPLAYGPIQVRISEALTLLPFFWGPWAAVGLWLGCIIANAWGGYGLLDVVGGCLLTLAAGLLSARMPNLTTAAVPPIVLNAFGVAGILAVMAGVPYGITVIYVGLGQLVAVGLLGIPIAAALVRRGLLRRDQFLSAPPGGQAGGGGEEGHVS